MIKENIKALDFELRDSDNNIVKLSDYIGKKVVLYFYPKDNTSGCTKQACSFSNEFHNFNKLNVEILAISKDSVKSHKNFRDKYSLPFKLLSDESLEVIKAYDVWKEKKLYGKTYMGIVRTTFLIDEKGVIEKIMEKVSPDKNVIDILNYYKEQMEK